MNVENIDLAIKMLKRIEVQYPGHFDMHNFQENDGVYIKMDKEDESTIRGCGTACCFSGWVNISEEFRNFPGKVDSYSSFELVGLSDIRSMAEMLGVDYSLADRIIYPHRDGPAWDEVWGKYNFNVGTMDKVDYSITNFDWAQIKPHHLADVLERIKSGELV